MNDVSIIPYAPEHQADFKQINVAWISEHFTIEAHDLEQLDHPEEHILPNGGQILLAQSGDDIIGTVALIATVNNTFELAKMAVVPAYQGRGTGKLLALAAIDFARQAGARMVWLESNRKAKAALELYRRISFVEVPLKPSPYTRADVCMELTL